MSQFPNEAPPPYTPYPPSQPGYVQPSAPYPPPSSQQPGPFYAPGPDGGVQMYGGPGPQGPYFNGPPPPPGMYPQQPQEVPKQEDNTTCMDACCCCLAGYCACKLLSDLLCCICGLLGDD